MTNEPIFDTDEAGPPDLSLTLAEIAAKRRRLALRSFAWWLLLFFGASAITYLGATLSGHLSPLSPVALIPAGFGLGTGLFFALARR